MRIIVLGGDGFLGWPVALHLSKKHDVLIMDNLSRRRIDELLDVESLTPIAPLYERCQAWRELGHEIEFEVLDARDYGRMRYRTEMFNPDVFIHFGAQPSAPYSMKDTATRRYTVENNVTVTNNVLNCVGGAHLIHMGTMGVYGYSADAPLPEGYTSEGELHPARPGSVYHTTKCLDELLFQFYAKNDGLKITDLHQGIVWGTHTDDTMADDRLINRFSYDGDYGTVLNRFLVQAVVGHPLTVHGSGGQTRAFIHIRDVIKCIELVVDNPHDSGVRIFNQMTETHRVKDLALAIQGLTGCEIDFVANPRKEAAENELNATHEGLEGLGLEPTLLSDRLMLEITDVVSRYESRVDFSKIPCLSTW